MGTNRTGFILQTENLTKRFGGITVANNINFAMPAGELRCLIGPNGAGKTTFFNLITGLIRPSRGYVYFMGKRISRLSSYKIARLGIGRSFQISNIYRSLSVAENVRIAVQRKTETFNPFVSCQALHGVDNKVMEILDRFHLTSKKDTKASQLSHGEQKRLEISITLACDPDLLLLDEPVAGLTTAETEEVVPLIKDICRQKVSILIIEHDMKFVKKIADTITVLHRGEILAEGTPDKIEKNEEVKKVYWGKHVWEENRLVARSK